MKRGFTALAIAVVTVLVLVLAYRFTTPGKRPIEPDVLQVGALPVT
ncbi:MAG TPA: hypothetical protein VKD28_08185 [Gemmatimonadales bacterium]|nr:hypothetical protein [Gemmatimonadales bacterium]